MIWRAQTGVTGRDTLTTDCDSEAGDVSVRLIHERYAHLADPWRHLMLLHAPSPSLARRAFLYRHFTLPTRPPPHCHSLPLVNGGTWSWTDPELPRGAGPPLFTWSGGATTAGHCDRLLSQRGVFGPPRDRAYHSGALGTGGGARRTRTALWPTTGDVINTTRPGGGVVAEV